MRSWIDVVALVGSTLRVSVPSPLPAERETLAVASALRVFERFSAIDGLVLVAEGGEVSLTRADVERLVAPEGFPALQERGRWPQMLARAVQRHCGAGSGSPSSPPTAGSPGTGVAP
jgi:hypothetical protein